MSLSALTKPLVVAYLDDVRSAATRGVYARVCAIVGLFFQHLVQDGLLAKVPVRIVWPKRLRTEIRVFTPEEMRRLRDVVRRENARDWAIFMLLNDTGIRSSGEERPQRRDDWRP